MSWMRFANWRGQAGVCACCRTIPPWQTVDWWFRRVVRHLLFRTIHGVAPMLDRDRHARKQSPSAAVVDSQSIKAPMAQKRGYDAGKRALGRKRHIAVDTEGRLLMVNLTTADIADSAGPPQAIVAAIRKCWPWLKHLFADHASGSAPLQPATGAVPGPACHICV